MGKLVVGEQMPDFEFVTPFEKGQFLLETAEKVKGKTAILFLRYYGCTLCQYDIHQFAVNYEKIRALDGQLLIVLQSDPDKLAAALHENDLPFAIICDPEQNLYHKFSIEAADSMVKLGDVKTAAKVVKATSAGFKHGDYEGNELQLPALFLIDREGMIEYVHYGTAAGDIPDPDGLVKIMA
jgi:peroxiredoxin